MDKPGKETISIHSKTNFKTKIKIKKQLKINSSITTKYCRFFQIGFNNLRVSAMFAVVLV